MKVFYSAAIVNVIAGLIFLVYGSGKEIKTFISNDRLAKLQPWGRSKVSDVYTIESDSKRKDKNAEL